MSDIHADEKIDRPDTRIVAEPLTHARGQSPMVDLAHLVATHKLKSDYLLLPGDTANRGNAVGLQYGWRRSHEIAKAMEARLVATPGNHDVVTHHAVPDASSMLKNLLPSFPTGDVNVDDAFWRSGWCVIEGGDHRIVILNSTSDFPAYPDGDSPAEGVMDSYFQVVDRGGLADNVETELEDYLASAEPKLNLMMVHHHPLEHQLSGHLQDGYGPMRRGGELIEILTRAHASGRWLVVHGHKHIPQLVSATTISANGPIILCAGSLGAKIWDPISTVARNQFHIVDVQLDFNNPVIGLSGSVMSYTWGVGVGWYLSERTGSGLPGLAGFGNAVESRLLAARVNAAIPLQPGGFARYDDVVAIVPELPFVLPADWDMLEEQALILSVVFVRNREGRIVSVGREASNV